MEGKLKPSRKSALKVSKLRKNEKESGETLAHLSPSEYQKQISTNPEAIIRKNANHNNKQQQQSSAFTSNPKAIIYRKFSKGNVYNVQLLIQNTSELPHDLRLVDSDSVNFNVTFRGSCLNTRLAPGMTHLYDVEFRPDEDKDYFHDVTFETDRGCFVVPVIACGPKPLLSFPDQIDMGRTALKVTRTKPILLQNTGNVATGFSVFTDNDYFTVSPSKGTIKVDEAVQLTINFRPLKTGISNGHVFLRYDSGDTVQSIIYGEAVKCDVRVREENVSFENTYLGLSRLMTLEIVNNSDYLVRYEWMKNKNISEDVEEKSKRIVEHSQILPRDDDDISKDLQEMIDKRVYNDSIQLLKTKSLTYDNDHFFVFPMQGEIWPCKSMQVSVTYRPKIVGDNLSVAYLEIDGLDRRIPVSLSGKCLGPALELNLLSLDVQKVYLCSTYIYEVICKNFGPISGTLMYIQKSADFGSTIQVKPSEMKVDVDELRPMEMSFRSNRTGNFIERIDFLIKESSEILSFVMKGKVICPLIRTFENDEEENLHFRTASLGFTTKKSLRFRNLSHEAIEFSLRIPSDGYEKCVTREDFAKTKPRFPECPCEFFICPCEGVVDANSPLHVQIFYTPNIARSENLELQIHLGKSSNAEPLILPMSVDAGSACFVVTPEDMKIRFCFLNFPYCRKMIVMNVSELEGYFYIEPQEIVSDTTVLYSLSTYSGTLKPNQSKEITLTLIVKSVGEQKFDINVHSLGLEDPVACSQITCFGQGSVITVEPERLNWGEVGLLRKKTLILNVVNESPIAAEFDTHLSKTKDVFEVEPSRGELDPNESIELKVSIFLRDTGSYSDKLIVSILNGKSISVSLLAIGVGTCIIFDPEIFPTLDLGIQFCRQNISIPIKVKNEGTRFHHILLTNEEKIKQGKKVVNEEAENAKFKIEPNVIELHPGEKQTIYCKIRQNTSQTVSESWYVNATLDSQGKRELLGISTITATFVEPNVHFDKCELTFRLDLGHDSETLRQSDQVEITNVCGRSVTAHITIDPPFRLIDLCNCPTDYIDLILANDEPFCARVCFPFDLEDSRVVPQKYEGYLRIAYDEHKVVDKLLCRAEVNYPHVICVPSELQIYCVHGWSAEERVKILNDSPLPAAYKIKLLKDTFSYRSLVMMSEEEFEGSISDKNLDISICPSSNSDDRYHSSKSDFGCEEGWSDSACKAKPRIPCIDLIDQFLQIVPSKGLIPPQSECYVNITFNGFERAEISIRAVCEVERGLSRFLTVNAISDTVRCEIQDQSLDFGLQLYCEPSISTLRVSNRCMLPLNYNVETSTSLLEVVQGPIVLEPDSESSIVVERRASAPGLFNEKLFLEVTHLEPFIIEVQWLATIPQVYLEILSTEDFEFVRHKKYDYEAIRLLTSEWITNDRVGNYPNAKCSCSDILYEDAEFSEYELMQLDDDNWHVISKDEKYPSQVDIDMAVERMIVKNWIEANDNKLPIEDSNKLLAPISEINMNYVTIDRTKQISIPLNNYGFEKAKVKLTRGGVGGIVGRKSPKSCLMVQLERNIEICQCESSTLCIAFNPRRDVFTDKLTVVNDKFYLDVKQGLRIPVVVQVTTVYPDVSVTQQKLNFGKVFVGDCRELSFVVKNDEYVDCQWEVIVESELSKSSDNPFSVCPSNGVLSPGQGMELKVYFKPDKNGKQKANLKIVIIDGKENKIVTSTGVGIDRKVHSDKSLIRFPPLIPNTDVVEDYFIIKNNNDYPVELYWKHKNDFSDFNRIVRVLRHYYLTKDILISKRNIGDIMPEKLTDFYNYLVQQMYADEDFKFLIDTRENVDDSSSLAERDAAEIESLLHVYIDKIQNNINFIEIMGDPLRELRENSTDKTVNVSEERKSKKKKLIVILYGAPGTEHQEIACLSAKALNLPLLNLDQAILEAISLPNPTPNAIKLSDQLDRRYRDLTAKLNKLTAIVSARSTTDNDEPSKILRLLRKIPLQEDLDRVDSYTRNEMKLDVIRSLVECVELKDKSSVKSQVTSGLLPGIGLDVIRDILRDRLAKFDFERGYVLQSLSNDFVKNEGMVLKTLLEATGEAEAYLLVALFDSESREEYRVALNVLLEAINEWETGKSTAKIPKKRAKSGKDKGETSKSDDALSKPTDKFFVWYVQPNNPHDEIVYKATVSNISSFFGRLVAKENSHKLKDDTPDISPSQTYSILKERDTFSITSFNNEMFHLSEHNFPVRSITESNLSRQKKISRAWSSTPELPLIKSDSSDDVNLEAIFTLEARESRQFRVAFRPTEEGRFWSEYSLCLMDQPDSVVKVRMEGIAEIPKVVCSLDSRILNFGNLLVLPDDKQPHKKRVQLKLENISTVFANVSLSLSDENYDCFDVDPLEMELEPLEQRCLDLTACTNKLGPTTDTLVLNVKHNDEPEAIELSCNGIALDIEIEPKRINLERILLNKTEKAKLIVRNVSAIALNWRLSIDVSDEQIQFVPARGKIKAEGHIEIEMLYHANEVSTLTNKFASFEVFLNEKNSEPIKMEIINVTAEIYQVSYHIQADDPIDFSKIPVSSASERSFVLKNTGQYGIKYELHYQDVDVLKKLLGAKTIAEVLERDIKVNPASGLVPPKKQTTINILFTPSIEMSINSIALFKLIIIEPYKDYGDVSEHSLNVSATSYYTRFLIEPHPKLDFGVFALKSIKTMQIKITNIGRFSLKYSIAGQLTGDLIDDRSSIITQRGKRSTRQRRLSKRPSTLQNAPTKWGPFKIEKIKGELPPGQADAINVHCSSDITGCFNEKLNITVLDSLPRDEESKQISLTADVRVAKLDFKNYHEMFAESHVVDSFEDSVFCPDEFGEYTVFAKSSKCLYFYRVYVGGEHKANITLRNIGYVNGDVTLEVSDDVFRIDQSRVSITPLSKQGFTLTFLPTSLGIFSAKLSIKLQLPDNIEPQTLMVDLTGEACVPRIQLINDPLINYGLMLVSSSTEKPCKIKNIGKVIANVIIEILDDPSAAYKITESRLKILPEEVIDVNVTYLPTTIKKYEARLKLSIERNPYEILEVNLIGEGFTKSIVLENLELVLSSNRKSIVKRNSKESLQKSRKSSLLTIKEMETTPLTYKLDYGNCFLNQINKITFRIANKTTDKSFRFQWDSLPNLVFTPTAGHLGPNGFKELTATFLSSEPTSLEQLIVSCETNEIILEEPTFEPLWDNRLTTVLWTEKCLSSTEFEICRETEEDVFMKKVITEIPEPRHRVVPGTLETVQLLVSVNANYSEYRCDVETINFEDTLMLQTSERKFRLDNTGTVDLIFSWNLVMDESYPMRLDQASFESRSSFESYGEAPIGKRQALIKPPTSELRKSLRFDCPASNENIENSDLFSSSAGLTDRSTDSWIEGENWPFAIDPESGRLSPGESIDCRLIFSPLDVFVYKASLQCKMDNLHSQTKPLSIAVNARSLLPYCHFEIEDSDYLTSGRRDAKLPVPSGYSLADPEVAKRARVAEFKILGIGELQTMNICFINPTSEDYFYRWTNLSDMSDGTPVFRCTSETGVAERGKRCRISLSIIPDRVGTFESFCQFEIKKYNLKTLFIIVANVSEPLVCCRKSMVKLKPVTTCQVTTESFEIVNNESRPLSFNLVKDSLYSEGRLEGISVCPRNGILCPNATQKFDITFEPRSFGEFIFNVLCQVEKLTKPIEIFVSAQVFELSCRVTYTNLDDENVVVRNESDNVLKIGQLPLNIPLKIEFKITNTGQLPFDYSWMPNTIDRNAYKIWVTEFKGRIEQNCHEVCYLELIASEKMTIRNHIVTLQIKDGPSYRIKLNASAAKQPVEFSFGEYDFGLCYVKTGNGIPYSAELGIANNQKTPCLVNCDFHEDLNIKLNCYQLQQPIPPKSSIKIPIYFRPTEETIYQQVLRFQVPNIPMLSKDIVIRGEGIPYKVHLKHPCDAILNIGQITVGKTRTRKLAIINEGRSTVTLRIVVINGSTDDTFDSSDSNITTCSRTKNSFTDTITSDTSRNSNTVLEFIDFSPKDWFDLKPNKEKLIAIDFQALRRIRSIEIKLGLDLDDSMLVPLTIIKAKCLAASLRLNRTYVSFGTVFECCNAEEKLILTNDGDLDTRFNWNTKNMPSNFDIRPRSGCCSAGRDIIFTCTFKPNKLGSCLRAEATLELKDYKNITVNMMANCCPLPEAIDVIDFTAEPNKTDKKEIKIENDSDEMWTLKPKILGRNFSTDPILAIEPKSSLICHVAYSPKRQTFGDCYDEGKLVIALPNGRSPIVYDIRARCSQAAIAKKYVRKVPAKKKFVETLTFYNESATTRTFDCNMDEVTEDNVQTVSSFKIDVMGNSQMEYKFPFYFGDEGRYFYKITFDDGYENNQCYEIEFLITSPELPKTIDMITYARSPTFCVLKVENSMEYRTLTFNANDIDDVIIHGLPVVLAPLEFKTIRLEYLPLLPCDKRETLTIKSEDLDEITYELHLVAKPAPPEKKIHVKSNLGSASDFALSVKNYGREPCEFDVTASDPAFDFPSTVNVPANEEIRMNVRFEPYNLETVDATIVAISNTAGEFVFPIVGRCMPPEPEGPFIVISDTPATITLKNVFLETKSFDIHVNNPDFILDDTKANVNSKESFEIRVRLRDDEMNGNFFMEKTGTVRVTCSDAALAGVKWIFYVRSVKDV